MTSRLYGQFLLSSQINYTCTYLADHLADLTHDNVQYFLKTSRFSPRQIWQSLKGVIQLSARGYLIFDDTVLSKEDSHRIELVGRQYSGNAAGLIKGIGVVNCIYYNPDLEQFWLIDYRIFSPQTDGKTKLDHLQDMLESAKNRQIPFQTLLMDTCGSPPGYATKEIFKYLLTEHKRFYCPIKANPTPKVSSPINKCKKPTGQPPMSKKAKPLSFTKCPWLLILSCSEYCRAAAAVTPNRTDYIITNDITQCHTQAAEKESSIRWTIELFQREAKQLTGIQNCQCRIARSQRNHIAMASLVWIKLKRLAYSTQKTIYQLKQSLLDDYSSAQLSNPSMAFA